MTCSKCGQKEARQNQRLCKQCHAAYMRSYRLKNANRLFLAGARAFRDDLVAVFTRIGRGEMNGYTAVEVVKNTAITISRKTAERKSG